MYFIAEGEVRLIKQREELLTLPAGSIAVIAAITCAVASAVVSMAQAFSRAMARWPMSPRK